MTTNVSMTEFLRNAVSEDDEKIVFNGKTLTAKRIFDDVDAVSASLVRLGVKKGDCVILALPSVPQMIVALYAANQIGAVADVLHPRCKLGAFEKTLAETKAKIVFTNRTTCKAFESVLRRSEAKIVLCEKTDYLGRKSKPKKRKGNTLRFSELTEEKKEKDFAETKGSDVAVYLHSSGTTGTPKTVALTNEELNRSAKNVYDAVNPYAHIQKDDAMIMTLPAFHSFGLSICVHLMFFCGKIILLPKFSAKGTVKLLKKHKTAFLALTPNMLRRLVERKDFRGEKLKSVKHIYVGGDSINEEIKEEADKRLQESGGNGKVCVGYGLSEAAGVVSIDLDGKTGSIGKPVPNVKVVIADEEGRETPVGETGMIEIEIPYNTARYADGKEVSEERKDGKRIITGDLGRKDEEGNLYFVGREKRVLKIGGVNVFPQEVEERAEKVKGVKKACAIRTKVNGKPAIKLFVQGKKSGKVKKRILQETANDILPYASPKEIEFVKEIKRTALGKADYRWYEQKENNVTK